MALTYLNPLNEFQGEKSEVQNTEADDRSGGDSQVLHQGSNSGDQTSRVRFFFTTVIALLFGTMFWNLGSKRIFSPAHENSCVVEVELLGLSNGLDFVRIGWITVW
ncbi:pleiotropic drug resistance protein 1-like protein [Corchorus olitorius]|uniref:Pleiotropic drug resistance protein 1-like protein n=1 Tax=Corchorus olitorius TaxID=93759 RepID=A0A1R3JZN9_9ROSI|nr:pleiotropic drug resistance protein 1-like protein [Corchorus olitorius]